MSKVVLMIFCVTLTLLSWQAFRSPSSVEGLLEDERNSVDVFEKTKNSVVNVTNIQVARNVWTYATVEVPRGSGSGFVWDSAGHIVTNYHVVDGGQSFTVSFYGDKRSYKAKLAGASPRRDIAVLKLIEKPQNISPVEMGPSSDLKVGQKALAIGNPFGFDHTMTKGIISALDRHVAISEDTSMRGMIQTDAAINPGNSGGPLFNSQGKVIGMNTMILSQSGTSAGIGLAVPADTITQVVPNLIKYGKEIRAVLGIQVAPAALKENIGIKKGVIIAGVYQKNGPAKDAGLKGIWRDNYGDYHLEDILLAINGKETNSLEDIFQILDQLKAGDSVELTVLRDKRTIKVPLKLSSSADL